MHKKRAWQDFCSILKVVEPTKIDILYIEEDYLSQNMESSFRLQDVNL